MRSLKNILGLGAVGIAAVMAASATFAADRTGVTDNQIKIGLLSSMTGPAAAFGTSNYASAVLAFEEVNAAGGINGRKIVWVSEDDETSPPKGIAAFKKLADTEKVFAIFGPSTSSVVAALMPTIKRSQVPLMISIASTPAAFAVPLRNVFRVGTLNDRLQGAAIADYATDVLKAKRIAVIRQSDEYGKRGAESVLLRLKKHPEVSVSEEVFNVTDTDYTSQLLRIREAKADVIIIYAIQAPAAIITRQARQLGLKATLLGSNASASRNFAATVGAAAIGSQNIITLAELPESDEPRMAAFRAKFDNRFPEYARQGRPEASDALAYGGAQVFIEGLRRAGRDLTREDFITALESIKNFDTGLILPTTLSANSHEGNRAARILEVQPDMSRKLLPQIINAE